MNRSQRLWTGPAAHGKKSSGCAVFMLASAGGLTGLVSIGAGFLYGAVT